MTDRTIMPSDDDGPLGPLGTGALSLETRIKLYRETRKGKGWQEVVDPKAFLEGKMHLLPHLPDADRPGRGNTVMTLVPLALLVVGAFAFLQGLAPQSKINTGDWARPFPISLDKSPTRLRSFASRLNDELKEKEVNWPAVYGITNEIVSQIRNEGSVLSQVQDKARGDFQEWLANCFVWIPLQLKRGDISSRRQWSEAVENHRLLAEEWQISTGLNADYSLLLAWAEDLDYKSIKRPNEKERAALEALAVRVDEFRNAHGKELPDDPAGKREFPLIEGFVLARLLHKHNSFLWFGDRRFDPTDTDNQRRWERLASIVENPYWNGKSGDDDYLLLKDYFCTTAITFARNPLDKDEIVTIGSWVGPKRALRGLKSVK